MNYTVMGLEWYALIFGLKMLREHLYGKKFAMVTDRKALMWLMPSSDPNHRLAHWISTLRPTTLLLITRRVMELGGGAGYVVT